MAKKENEVEMFYPSSRKEWRDWLEENHRSKQSVWLIQYKKKSNINSISWSEAVDEALCFGWIDSIRKSLDGDKFMQFFCKRKAKSVWSKINKGKIEQLIKDGLMTEAGFESIETAKQNASWYILDDVEELNIPPELEMAFNSKPGSLDYFLSLSKSVKKAMLYRIALAKLPETKDRRINDIIDFVSQGMKAK